MLQEIGEIIIDFLFLVKISEFLQQETHTIYERDDEEDDIPELVCHSDL
jgi:hypothetical protein